MGVKQLWGSDFLDFLLPKTSPHMGHLTGVNFFLKSESPSQRSLRFQRVSSGRASLVPAAAVIPAPIAYIKIVAVKTLVVGYLLRGSGPSQ